MEFSEKIITFDPTDGLSLPTNWKCVRAVEDGKQYLSDTNLKVIISGAVELDGKKWIHVSLSRKSRVPTYAEIAIVKRIFIGRDKKAVQVFAPESQHVNIHPYCLHLWHCVDGDPLPDFTHGKRTI